MVGWFKPDVSWPVAGHLVDASVPNTPAGHYWPHVGAGLLPALVRSPVVPDSLPLSINSSQRGGNHAKTA